MQASLERVRGELAERLRARRDEIEEALLTRTYAIADPKETADPEYAQGLRAALSAALEYGIAALERAEDRSPPIPTILLGQARLAARNRVSLDTVLRRYFAGYTLLGDFLIEEVERIGLKDGSSLKRLLRIQARLFDRLIAAVTEEYGREDERPGSSEERRAKTIRRLLDGELTETSDLAYEFEGWHLGILASGPEAQEWVKDFAASLDCRFLYVQMGEHTVWVWLGFRRGPNPVEIMATSLPAGISLAIGEPSRGLAGWRMTHRQAKAALPIALRNPGRCVHYADVALLTSALRDDLLASSLQGMYLDPLMEDPESGARLLETLRAYFKTDRSVSSTAVALGLSRQTVSARLRMVEEKVGRSLTVCAAEMETAIQLERLSKRKPR